MGCWGSRHNSPSGSTSSRSGSATCATGSTELVSAAETTFQGLIPLLVWDLSHIPLDPASGC